MAPVNRQYAAASSRYPDRLLHFGERQRVRRRVKIHEDRGPGAEAPLEYRHRERVLQLALNRALEWASAEDRIVALIGQELLGRLRQLDIHLLLAQQPPQVTHLDLDDGLEVLARQAAEEDHLVDTVQELGPEGPIQLLHHLRCAPPQDRPP